MEELLDFLQLRHKVLENSQFDKPVERTDRAHPHKRGATDPYKAKFAYPPATLSCYICKDPHITFRCPKLTNANVEQRLTIVKTAGVCLNCLRPHHVATQCTASTCKQCNGKHHTLLHGESSTTQPPLQINVAALKINCPSEVLLSTAIINIHDSKGSRQPCRMLLDSGSQSNFLTERLASKLSLIRTKTDIPVIGINHIASHIKSIVTTRVSSRINNFSTEASFLILPKITESLPSQTISKTDMPIPNNLPLADPKFRVPAEVDGIIGAELFFDLICVGQIPIKNSSAKLQKTKFGWVVSGKTKPQTQPVNTICSLTLQPLDVQLTKFWEMEEPPRGIIMSREESVCEKHYVQNVTRDLKNGSYIVKLPFTEGYPIIGDSYSIAFRRLLSLEKTFAKNFELQSEYLKFMNEYLELGHMTKLTNPRTDEGYYLPHHSVTKKSSLTTKLRVVFDASAKTSLGISLNDTLMTGPTIHDDLCTILLRFRTHNFVLTADIEKMYRQISIHPTDRIYQKILWRPSPQHPIQTYTLNTVTYGTSAAPFLAIRSLYQLAHDEEHHFPRASTILREDFYVDDLLTGAQTLQEAQSIRDELINLCSKGGFKLRQWASNDERLLKSIHDKTTGTHVRLDLDETVKTLGLQWNARHDTISYTISDLDTRTRITKRTILSQIAALFDPLGLLGPVIVRAKILLQKLWQLKLDWDESLPLELHTAWSEQYRELPLLRNIRFHRHVTSKDYEFIQLHGFCDASERAYGACLYIRTIYKSKESLVRLLCSKSRVAPLKTINIPRLELCAAHLLMKLYKASISALRRMKFEKVFFWSNSTIALHWLNTSPHQLKTFVAHRVTDIQNNTDIRQWRHIASEHNPADLISRGLPPRELVHSHLWHHGPEWLLQPESTWPTGTLRPINVPEIRPIVTLTVQLKNWDVIHRFSTFQHMKRVFAYCLRFIKIVRYKTKLNGPLSVQEIQTAETQIVKIIQRESLSKEMQALRSSDNSNNHLSSLSPFLDDNGILRVGGRLSRTDLPCNSKHPILISREHAVTKLIIRDHHLRNLHAGTQATLNSIRKTFWIPQGKTTIRRVIHECVTCHRAKPSVPTYTMGDLPKGRVNQSRPFLHTGVDYCGPIFIKEKPYRNRNKIKVYLAIFVCFTTKALHIEIVSDLSTDAFLAALRRFFSRRGRSTDIYSDNATNFVGAKRELKELFANLQSQQFNDTITETLSNDGIRWHLIPPRSPHFGGLWEAAVKSTKFHLLRTIGDTLLSYEVLLTYLNQIEAILNSRPITPLSSDPNDLQALTPAHFLIGDTFTSTPDHEFAAIPTARLSTWQHIQKMRQHFWKRWTTEYLHEHTTRRKWHSGKATNIVEGQMVILRDDNMPPMKWPLGRIIETHSGEDGSIRVVTVRTAHGTYKRSVKKLSPLPINDD